LLKQKYFQGHLGAAGVGHSPSPISSLILTPFPVAQGAGRNAERGAEALLAQAGFLANTWQLLRVQAPILIPN
jgi:hypothetical protein